MTTKLNNKREELILKFHSRVSSLVGRFRNVPLLLFPLTADCNREPSSFANVRFLAFSFVNGFTDKKKEIIFIRKKNSKFNLQ